MNSKPNKSFEDRLKERLHSEELPYEEGAWERFDMAYPAEKGQKSSQRWTRLRWPLLVLLVSMTAAWIYFLQVPGQTDGQHLSKLEQSQSATSLQTEADMQQKDITDVVDGQSTRPDRADALSNTEQVRPASKTKHTQPSRGDSSLDKEETTGSGTLAVTTSAKVTPTVSSGSATESGSTETTETTPATSISAGVSKTDTPSTNRSKTKQGSDLVVEESTSGTIGREGTQARDVSAERTSGQSSIPSSQGSTGGEVGPAPTETSVSETDAQSVPTETVQERDIVELDLIQLLTPTVTLAPQMDVSQMTIPYRYKKNKIYVGMAFDVSRRHIYGGPEGIASVSVSEFRLGYQRKLSPVLSVGLEASMSQVRNLEAERFIEDYHLTSSSFEFIELNLKHSGSTFFNVPLLLEYSPYEKGWAVFAGARVSYALQHGITVRDLNNLTTNVIIEQVRAVRQEEARLHDWDYGLVVGGRFTLWDRLEFDARYNLGLGDITDDAFWGPRRNTSSHISLGMNYKINW